MADGRVESRNGGARLVTATDALIAHRAAATRRLPLLLGIAARELRSGLAGFRIFIACVALGVMVITGVGAVSDALRAGFERQGEAILGGDVTLSRMHVRAVGEERAVIDAFGRVSETATMRTMARRPDGARSGAGRVEGRRCRLSAGRQGRGRRRQAAAGGAARRRRRRSGAARAAGAEGRRSHRRSAPSR